MWGLVLCGRRAIRGFATTRAKAENAGAATYRARRFFVAARPGGTMNSHDPVNATHQPGEPLWVVYNPADPNHNSLWPPIA
ncbi:MAG: hypothetical protein IPG17_28840 [Sandaracinaceae bacterium]|nr:hypothetical protein [Sandaracinaceae bacterium]